MLGDVAKMAQKVAKISGFAVFEWQNADTFAELVAKTQIIICNLAGAYSNT